MLSNAFALLSFNRFDTIEHSENGIIFQSGMFENEIGPGVLQSSIRQTRVLQEYQMNKPRATDVDSVHVVRNFADYMFVDYWTRAPQVSKINRGNAYNRGMRAHKLLFVALSRLKWKAFIDWIEENNMNVDHIDEEVKNAVTAVQNFMKDAFNNKDEFRTAFEHQLDKYYAQLHKY